MEKRGGAVGKLDIPKIIKVLVLDSFMCENSLELLNFSSHRKLQLVVVMALEIFYLM